MSKLQVHVQTLALDDAVDAAKAAKRSAIRTANILIDAWLNIGIEAAKNAASQAEFDQVMRQDENLLNAHQAYDLTYALTDTGFTSLLDALRVRLERWNDEFPFKVEIYRSVKQADSYVLTIPNQAT